VSTEACRILLISGSLRGGSTNTALLRTACEVAPEGIETHVYEGWPTCRTSVPTPTPRMG